MNWVLNHYDQIGFWLFVLEKLASATPENLVICKVPIGKWDNQIVKGIKAVFKAVFLKGGKG